MIYNVYNKVNVSVGQGHKLRSASCMSEWPTFNKETLPETTVAMWKVSGTPQMRLLTDGQKHSHSCKHFGAWDIAR